MFIQLTTIIMLKFFTGVLIFIIALFISFGILMADIALVGTSHLASIATIYLGIILVVLSFFTAINAHDWIFGITKRLNEKL